MPIDLDINVGEVLKLPTGLYRFCEERPNKVLLLQREGTAFDLPLPEWKLKKMLGDGTAEKIDFVKSDDASARGPNDNPDFGPGEDYAETADGKLVPTPELLRAKALQFYTMKWDEIGCHNKGAKFLQKLITTWRPICIQKGYEPKPRNPDDPDPEQPGAVYLVKPARLKHAIDNCGKEGERPLRVFRSRRGKTLRKRFPDFVEEALDKAVSFYWKLRERSYDEAYAVFRVTVDEENDRRKAEGAEALKFPDRAEILRRRINKAANYVNWARKYSPHEAHQKFKGTNNALYAEAPLDLVIMDHTTIDAWTVLDTETFLPLGRPYLTVALDVCTRMPLGYLISFEPASLYSVMTTLKRVNKNKAYVKKLYPDLQHAWDGWGRPRQILVDNGWEFKSPSFQDALHDLGTDVIWAPVQTPQYKAVGERFFQTLNLKLFHRLQGGVPYDPKRMRLARLDPQAKAVITLEDLDGLMHEMIVDGYQWDKHEGLNEDRPARLWREKIIFFKRPWIRDIKALNAILGRTATAKLYRNGITFKNMQFHERDVTTRLMDDLTKLQKKRTQSSSTHASGRARVKIKWNPIDASSIEVWNEGAETPHYVTLRNRDQKYFKGLSFWHFEQIRDFALREGLEFQTESQRWAARNTLREHWEELAGLMPMRKSRDARRGLSYSQGTFDDNDVNEDQDLTPDDIENGEAPPIVPDMPAASERKVHQAPKGKSPSKASIRKAQRTRARNAAGKPAKSRPAPDSTGPISRPTKPIKTEKMSGDDLKTNGSKYWEED